MKPIFIRLLAFLLPLTMANPAEAQSRIQTLAFSKSVLDSAAKNLIRFEKEAAAENDQQVLYSMKAASGKLYKNFSTRFASAYDIDMEVKRNVQVSCLVNGLRNRPLYTKAGKMLHNLRYYDMSLLPEEVAETVYNSYPGYQIFSGITEVEVQGITTYFVLIEDKKTWKRVKVTGDNIEVHEDFIKTADQSFAGNDY